MKILQEETLKVIQYKDRLQFEAHKVEMENLGFVVEMKGWRYGKYNAVYKKNVV